MKLTKLWILLPALVGPMRHGLLESRYQLQGAEAARRGLVRRGLGWTSTVRSTVENGRKTTPRCEPSAPFP